MEIVISLKKFSAKKAVTNWAHIQFFNIQNKHVNNVEPTSSVQGFFPKRPFFETASLCFE
jgi:hypothetical protein